MTTYKRPPETRPYKSATLSFDLTSEDGRVSHLRAIKADNLCDAIWDFQNLMREEYKYIEQTAEQMKAVERIRQKFFDVLSEHDVDIDKLIY